MASDYELLSNGKMSPSTATHPIVTSTPSQDMKSSTFLSVLSKPSEKILPKSIKELRTAFKEFFKKPLKIEEEKSQTSIPYYTDLRTNTYGILGDTDAPETGDPYNITVSAFIAESDLGTVNFFKDSGVKKEALPILEDLALYIHKLKHAAHDYRVENGTSSRSKFFKHVNDYVADLYWSEELKYGSPFVPNAPPVKRGTLKKRTELPTVRGLLKQKLMDMNSGEFSDRMANFYIFAIQEAVKIGMELNKQYYLDEFIAQHKRFTPTLKMLMQKGRIPDYKIAKYKSLFLLSEWNEVQSSALFKGESAINDLIRKPISHSNIKSFIKEMEKFKNSVETDLLSAEAKKLKQERLFLATKMKGKSSAVSFKMAREVRKNLAEPRIREAFNPLRLMFAAGKIKTTPGEGMMVLLFDDTTEHFYASDSKMAEGMDAGLVKNRILEFASWLNT